LQSGRDGDKLAGLDFRPAVTGSPILAGAVGWFACQVETKLDIGERTLYVGEVVDGALELDRPPLRWQRARALASPEQLAQLKEQTESQASGDAERIRAWRQTHCG
jgi:flavin reductase (DIM6/NTAB) family NADH-FMN oxidoreductase RutF